MAARKRKAKKKPSRAALLSRLNAARARSAKSFKSGDKRERKNAMRAYDRAYLAYHHPTGGNSRKR